MQNTRPYSVLSEITKRQRQEKVAFLYIKCVLAIAGIILVFALLRILFMATPARSQQLINASDKAEIHRRLDARGLSRATTVEITETGYRAEFEGGWIKL